MMSTLPINACVQLDCVSGIVLARRLADCGSTIPVILITAHDEPSVREQALRADCGLPARHH